MISQSAQAAFQQGQEWEDQKNPAEAINAYREAAAIESGWVAPYQRLGALFLELGQYEQALAACQQAKPLMPSGDGSMDDLIYVIQQIQANQLDPAAYHYYALARDLPDEQVEDKMTLCQNALGLNLSFAAPYAEIGKILLEKEQLNQARAVLERGLAYKPPPFVQAQLLFHLANTLLFSFQFGEALAAFHQVVGLDANPRLTKAAAKQIEQAAAAGHN
jgi:tetratricopeptide (TPR) repeat protein